MIRSSVTALSTAALMAALIFSADVLAEKGGNGNGNGKGGGGGGDSSLGDDYTATEGVSIAPSAEPGFDYEIVGTGADDEAYGGPGNDFFEGFSGEDKFHGKAGNDELHGGNGPDLLWGGPGTDALFGGDGEDFLFFSLGANGGVDSYDGGAGNDLLLFNDAVSVTADLEGGMYTANAIDESGALVVVVGSFSAIEAIWGSSGDDIIDGSLTGDDVLLYGHEGNDILSGLGGNDEIIGGPGDDQVFGGDGNDQIKGEPGDDYLDGGPGDDVLTASPQGVVTTSDDDRLVGGPGNDRFIFGRLFGTDTIEDFEEGELIQFEDSGGFYGFDFGDVTISEIGDDIHIFVWKNKGGGVGGTIILEGAVSNGVVIDQSDFIF